MTDVLTEAARKAKAMSQQIGKARMGTQTTGSPSGQQLCVLQAVFAIGSGLVPQWMFLNSKKTDFPQVSPLRRQPCLVKAKHM